MSNNFRKISVDEFERLKSAVSFNNSFRTSGNKLYKVKNGKNIRIVNFVFNEKTNCYQCLLQSKDAGSLINELIK